MAEDKTPKPAGKPAAQGETTIPGGLLADQSFAEDRNEVEGGRKAKAPAPPHGSKRDPR
jgi:hypothetical protein